MKRAISKEDIKRIIELDLRTVTTYHSPYLSLGRDLFLFSYLSCGINLTDMARIRYCDIFERRLSYHRQKTGKLISFQLQPMAYLLDSQLNQINMSNATFIPYQRLELQSMSPEKLLNIIRIAAENYPNTSLILTPRIDQSGQAYYWTGLRYGGCTELDFKLCLNKEIEAFILWLQSHLYRHLEYAQTVRDFTRTSNGRTFQNRKLTFPTEA